MYIGITNNILRRAYEHKQKIIKGFTTKYNVIKLVYTEEFADIKKLL
nr:GIY-YIG nuclease family protein [Rickettsia monacensis]